MPETSRSAALDAIARRLGLAALLVTCATPGWAAPAEPKKDAPAPPAATQPAAAPKPSAGKSPAAAAKATTRIPEAVPRFTNEDLPKVAGDREGATEDAEEAGGTPTGDAAGSKAKKPRSKAAEAGTEEEAEDFETVLGEEERAAKTVLLQRQLADAEKRIEQLESRRRALQNPLHAGLVPAGTEEQEAVGGQGNDVRLAWVDEQIRAARRAMDRDREELARIQAP